MKKVSDDVFRNRVNDSLNDFADWTENTFGRKDIAENLRKAEKNKETYIEIIQSGIEDNKTTEEKKEQLKEKPEHKEMNSHVHKEKNHPGMHKKHEPEMHGDYQTKKQVSDEDIDGQHKHELDESLHEEIKEEINTEKNKPIHHEHVNNKPKKNNELYTFAVNDQIDESKYGGVIEIVDDKKKTHNVHYSPVQYPKEKIPFMVRINKMIRKIRRKNAFEKKESKIEKGNVKDEVKESQTKTTQKEHKHKTDQDFIYKPEYVRTGVIGFDELITLGIPKGSAILVSGGAGTGKTTFTLNVLNNFALLDKNCLYLTFEEEVFRLRHHMENYGWNPAELEKKGRLIIKKMDPFNISRSVEALLAKASGELIIEIDELEDIIPSGFHPDFIVLDSLSAVAAAFIGKEEGYRIYVEQLFNMFRKIGSTSFLISEVEENANTYTKSGVEEFLADAVVVFYNLRQKNVRVNALEIIKIRGTSFQKKIVPFKIISGEGIKVFPKEDPFLS